MEVYEDLVFNFKVLSMLMGEKELEDVVDLRLFIWVCVYKIFDI